MLLSMRRFILYICILTLGLTAWADELHWLSTEYDFGTIREAAGKARGQVQFVNAGTGPTIIQRVKSTCGCTGVGYTRDIIEPGDTATVWFDYNPTGRPGRFEKHIKVYTGEAGDLTSITIKGTVIGTPHSLEANYPEAYGPLRLSSDQIPMGELTWGTSTNRYIHGYNQEGDTLTLSWEETPRCLTLGVSSKQILPGDLFTLSAYLNTRDGMEMGTTDIPVTLHADSPKGRTTAVVHVTATVMPDYSKYTDEELRSAPVCVLSPTVIELPSAQLSGKKGIPVEVTVQNDGKSPLILSRVHCPELPGLVKLKSMPRELKQGQYKPLKLEVRPEFLPSGEFKIPVEVVTNDPLHPVRTLFLAGIRMN